MLQTSQAGLSQVVSEKSRLSHPPDLIIIFQYLIEFEEVQAFEATHFYRVILKTPFLGLEW